MQPAPSWFKPVAILALLWNLAGCLAYLSDVMLSPADIAAMTPDQQAMYAMRPAWSVAATALAVWGGALGCVGLIMRKRWAVPVLSISLIALLVQDLSLFVLSDAARLAGPVVYVLQAFVLLVSVLLLVLARRAQARGWLV